MRGPARARLSPPSPPSPTTLSFFPPPPTPTHPPPPPSPLSPLSQNRHSGSTSIAQWNLDMSDLLNTFSIGTSARLHQATVMRGSR